MKKLISLFSFLAAVLLTAPVLAAPVVGQAAPAFTATDSNGHTVKLEDYKGKTVVLEWTNHQCPFVMKHYGSGNMQVLQKKATADDIIWLSVISSAPGKQGHVDGATANKLTAERSAAPTAVLLDGSGELGRLYDAKTTPHMFVIDKEGTLVYAGAIDSIPSPRERDVAKADNYVAAVLEDIKAGVPIRTPMTKSYGCSVKYAG